jgi:hypothetical protein
MGEARKIVTIVFADVTGSTHLGEELDAEALRRVPACRPRRPWSSWNYARCQSGSNPSG